MTEQARRIGTDAVPQPRQNGSSTYHHHLPAKPSRHERKTPYEMLVGDVVRCVDGHCPEDHILGVVEGREYTVDQRGTYIIGLEGVVSLQYAWRFVRVSEPQ